MVDGARRNGTEELRASVTPLESLLFDLASEAQSLERSTFGYILADAEVGGEGGLEGREGGGRGEAEGVGDGVLGRGEGQGQERLEVVGSVNAQTTWVDLDGVKERAVETDVAWWTVVCE